MMTKNPFKFGSIVDGKYFTNRKTETEYVRSILNSENHLVVMSPRRYGKSSLINRVIIESQRPVIILDLQLVTDVTDLSAQLLKRIYRLFPFERLKQYIQHFRIIPNVSLNPVTNSVDVSFLPQANALPVLEDVLNLIEQLGSSERKIIVVFDEFQEVVQLEAKLPAQMRSVMQYHTHINYVFLGSQESMIREIFEKKKSPFYHFGLVLTLDRIPEKEFGTFLTQGFSGIVPNPGPIAGEILKITQCHPYYTQQLAFITWEECLKNEETHSCVEAAINKLLEMHDMDYERLWNSLNKTDQKLLIGLASSSYTPLSESFIRQFALGATSTVFSSLKRLIKGGYVIKNKKTYEPDDPFFARWIKQRRDA